MLPLPHGLLGVDVDVERATARQPDPEHHPAREQVELAHRDGGRLAVVGELDVALREQQAEQVVAARAMPSSPGSTPWSLTELIRSVPVADSMLILMLLGLENADV
jgi:chaperone required for assembly of F1-ATPase